MLSESDAFIATKYFLPSICSSYCLKFMKLTDIYMRDINYSFGFNQSIGQVENSHASCTWIVLHSPQKDKVRKIIQ